MNQKNLPRALMDAPKQIVSLPQVLLAQRQVRPFSFQTPSGIVGGSKGDWLCRIGLGEYKVIQDKDFHLKYVIVTDEDASSEPDSTEIEDELFYDLYDKYLTDMEVCWENPSEEPITNYLEQLQFLAEKYPKQYLRYLKKSRKVRSSLINLILN